MSDFEAGGPPLRLPGMPIKQVGEALEIYDVNDFDEVPSSRVQLRNCNIAVRTDDPCPFRAYMDPESGKIVAVHVDLVGYVVLPVAGRARV